MNKGFTLIELLAVIVIVALISLLSIISISKIVSKSKADLYDSQLIMIEKAAKSWGSENISKLPDAGECLYLTLGSLKTYGALSDNIIDPKTNTKIPDALKIKISSTLNQYNNLVINYEVDAQNVDGCRYIYGDYTIVDGESFNRGLKNYMNSAETNIDTKIKSIVFLKPGQYPSDIGVAFRSYNSLDLSVNKDESVLGYFINNTVYIYSDGVLEANAISDRMFYGMSALESIDFSGLSTSNVVSMTSMFENCYSIKYLDLSNFDTTSTLRMDNMFSNCSNLETLDINNFSLSRVSSNDGVYTNMFSGCGNPNIIISPDMEDFVRARLNDSNVEINLTIK